MNAFKTLIFLYFFQVYDHDWAFRDDFMGEGGIPLFQLELDKLTERIVTLAETDNTEYLGQIVLGLRLVPKSAEHGSEAAPGSIVTYSSSHLRSGSIGSSETPHPTPADAHGHPVKDGKAAGVKKRPQLWSATVNIVLVEGKDLMAMDLEGTSDPYCKVR